MFIEALTVCTDSYADILPWFMLFNKPQFDNIIVVTTPDDKKTQKICKYHNIEAILTFDCYHEGQKFCKSRMINAGLRKLTRKDWVVHIDADIALFPRSLNHFRNADLNTKNLYGIDRVEVIGAETLFNHISEPEELTYESCFLRTEQWKILPRISIDGGNYSPPGYFQMWNPKASEVYIYPEHEKGANAARSDMAFTKYWAPRNRVLFPMALGMHIEPEATSKGANWDGNKNPAPFKIGAIDPSNFIRPKEGYV